MTAGQAFLEFWPEFWILLPQVLPRLLLAWLPTFFCLIYGFKWLKAHVRPVLLRMDDRLRYWAVGLRYRVRGEGHTERHALTWFFRFWTNFASSPSLCVLSFVVPMAVAAAGLTAVVPKETAWPAGMEGYRMFYLPGFCFAGGMLLSFISKKVFRRLRPERVPGAFGHKLKDGSFPSGHSLTVLCFWSMLGVAVASFGFSGITVALFGLISLSVILLTGLSRIYLGVHFPSDVLGGYTIGAIWSVVCYFALFGVL